MVFASVATDVMTYFVTFLGLYHPFEGKPADSVHGKVSHMRLINTATIFIDVIWLSWAVLLLKKLKADFLAKSKFYSTSARFFFFLELSSFCMENDDEALLLVYEKKDW